MVIDSDEEDLDYDLLAARRPIRKPVKQRPPSFDQILEWIEPMGLWQILLLSVCAFGEFTTTLVNLEVIFYQVTPSYVCDPENPALNWTFEQMRSVISPMVDGSYDGCFKRNLNYTNLASENYDRLLAAAELENAQNESLDLQPCQKWVFNNIYLTNTIVTEWDLVCDKKWLVEHGVSLNFAGFLLGVLFAGYISDRFGRRTSMLLTALIYVPAGLVCTFAHNYILFVVLRMLAMIGATGHAVVIYCYGLEVVGAHWRSLVGGLFFVPYAGAYVCLSGMAYLLPDWRHLNIACVLPGIPLILLCIVVPESPRWLLAKGQVQRATRVMDRAAKVNRADIPSQVDFRAVAEAIIKEEIAKKKKSETFTTLLHYPALMNRSLILYFIWLVVAMVYFGLSLNVSSFDGNLFVNNALSGAIEFPGYALSYAMLYLGRTKATYATFFFCGTSLLLIPMINATATMVLAMAGKLGVTIAFAVVYVLTCELYPTTVRNFGLSTSSAAARIGSMVSPYIAGLWKLGASYSWLPMVIFGTLSMIAGVVACSLPETLGKRMPESLPDAERLELAELPKSKKEISEAIEVIVT